MLPAVRAEGPLRPEIAETFVPESRRPDEPILDALEAFFCHDSSVPDFEPLCEAVRKVFCKSCLQQSRLRATAQEWQDRVQAELLRTEEVSVQWAAWHSKLATYLCHVDFVDWLVPDAVDADLVTSTFRDGSTVLPWLAVGTLALPRTFADATPQCVLVSAKKVLCQLSLRPEVHWLGHQACFQQPALLDFSAWAHDGSAFALGFCLAGLLGSLVLPAPISSYRMLEPKLCRLRLFADLVRGVVFLWSKGVRAFIVAEPVECPGLTVVRRIAPVTTTVGSLQVYSNCQEPLRLFVSPA